MDGSNSNISRDAYTTNDAHASRDPHASRNAHSQRDPYENKNPYDKNDRAAREKEPSIYGWGHYCDRFFEIENLFRTKYTDDTQIHIEKRDYIGSGDLASILPKMSKITASSFSYISFLFLVSALLLFFIENVYTLYGSMATLTILFIWRFVCPSYLLYNGGQYLIGDEYRGLFKNFKFFIQFIEFGNLFFSSLILYYSAKQQESISYLFKNISLYLYENAGMFKEKLYGLTIKEVQFEGIETLALTYFTLSVVHILYFTYFNRVVVVKKYYKNYQDIKLKRLANQYQRKAHILNGENQ